MPLSLHLNAGNYTVTQSRTVLKGTATRGASVSVNGQVVQNRAGRWRRLLRPRLGTNRVSVEASMAGHPPIVRVISVTRHRTSAEIAAGLRARHEAEARAAAKARAEVLSLAKENAEAQASHGEGESGCTNGTYTNSAGNTVCKPEESSTTPEGATAKCGDGTYSFSESRSGTCSHHEGVAEWLSE
jgi:hypothetical protein